MGKMYGVRDLGRMFGVPTPRISQVLFHDFSEQDIPLVGQRRIIPAAQVPRVAEALRNRGVRVKRSACA